MYVSLKEQVAEKILAVDIIADVVNVEVEAEKKRRVDLLTKAYRKVQELDDEFDKKLKAPDAKTYDAEGAEVSVSFSEGRHQERKKNREKADRLRTLINEAADQRTFKAYENIEKALS